MYYKSQTFANSYYIQKDVLSSALFLDETFFLRFCNINKTFQRIFICNVLVHFFQIWYTYSKFYNGQNKDI